MGKLREIAKWITYRTPLLNGMMQPTYAYKINPAQLGKLITLIDSTRSTGGSVIEIGVAQGNTSTFILEHLKTTGDQRELLLFDTFCGFTDDSVKHEVLHRDKAGKDYIAFRYGEEGVFRRNLLKCGYKRFRTFRGDAAQFDWATVAPIGVVLLDIDLYLPTRKVLSAIWPHLVAGGGIVVDDCLENSPWDGSLQAYKEFIEEMNLPFLRVGEKGCLIQKQG